MPAIKLFIILVSLASSSRANTFARGEDAEEVRVQIAYAQKKCGWRTQLHAHPRGKRRMDAHTSTEGKRVRSSRPMQARHCGRPSPHTPAVRGRSGGEAEPENPPAGKMQKATRHLLRTTPKKKNPGYSPGSRFRKPSYLSGKFSSTDCYSNGFFSALMGMRQMTPSANSQQYR